MKKSTRHEHPPIQGLPHITLRQLEVFRTVYHEQSFANAAHELRSTRPNVKRLCGEFERALGRPLFEEIPDHRLQPTAFASGLIDQICPLTRALRRLKATVATLHEKGRILRFGASGEFFKGGIFTEFLTRLNVSHEFRPCFLRIDPKRFSTALLNAECDIYFGIGIAASDRLDLVHLQPVPWKLLNGDGTEIPLPPSPAALPEEKWWISGTMHGDTAQLMLDAIHDRGGVGGRFLPPESEVQPAPDELVLTHDASARRVNLVGDQWPMFHFSAALKKHHPYDELLPRLTGAAIS